MRMRLPNLLPAVLCSALALTGCASTRGPAADAADAMAEAAAGDDAGVATASGLVGTLDGAPYRIDMPADWNGDLVVYLHGYEPAGMPRPEEMPQNDFDRWLLSKGYLLAQSAYSAQGWAIAEALDDSEKVRQLAVESYGAPKRTFLIGHSMGAHAALATLERQPQHYDGALALCGVNAPNAEVFADAVVPPLLAFDLWFPGALGLAPGGLADPASPPFVPEETFAAALAGNEARAQQLATRFEMPRDGLAGGLMIRYLALREMIRRAGGFPVDNRATRYSGLGDDAAFNAAVRRHAGDPPAIAYVRANAELAGRAPKPVVVLSNAVDPTVPPSIAARYAAMARTGGNGGNVLELPPTGVGHCAFGPADVDAAFAVLESWVRSGQRPGMR